MTMRRLLPSGLLPRIRLAALVLGGLGLLLGLAQIRPSTTGPSYHQLSRAAVLLLGGDAC